MPSVLDGARVVTLAPNLPGPLAAARLAELGASVIKVEGPAGDVMAQASPDWYGELTKGQQVLQLDLKNPADRLEFDEALGKAALLITSMRPSALRRLGLSDAPSSFPGLSHIEIVGHDGDHEEMPGHDLTYQATYGTLQPPAMPDVPVADMLGAERAVSESLAALIEFGATGKGQVRRVVLEDAAERAGAAVRHGLMGPGTLLGGGFPTYGIYPTADGNVAVGALEPHFHNRLLEVLEVEGTRDELARVFATRTIAEWEDLAAAVDVPIVGIRSQTQGATK